MGNLSVEQAQQVSDLLHAIADSISNYVIENAASLSDTESRQIMDTQQQILNLADGVLDKASNLVFQDVDLQMTQLNSINNGIADKLKTLGSIQDVIEIAADILTLTTDICSLNPGGIASSAGDILNKLGIKINI